MWLVLLPTVVVKDFDWHLIAPLKHSALLDLVYLASFPSPHQLFSVAYGKVVSNVT